MGVLPEHHRAGIGRALLQAAESWLAARDIEFLQVKTLSPRHPDPGYAATRAFYFGCGFRPLEEMPELWGPDQPALQMIKVVPPLPPAVRSRPLTQPGRESPPGPRGAPRGRHASLGAGGCRTSRRRELSGSRRWRPIP